jgi:CDP-diacylglycerol--glycerol-3-phosphate 3-phosphatidyltransferase
MSKQSKAALSAAANAVIKDDMVFNTTPNQLTLLRMAFVPVVVGLLFFRNPVWDIVAALVFTAASITDYLDGYIARKQGVETVYGKLMDPLADKFLVVSALIILQYVDRIHPVVVILLICREMAITGLRALASAEGVIIPASSSGKWKTATQMVAIPFLMVRDPLFGVLPLFRIGNVLLYVSLAISLWSAKDYCVDFFRAAKLQRKERAAQRKEQKQAKIEARKRKRAAKKARLAANASE